MPKLYTENTTTTTSSSSSPAEFVAPQQQLIRRSKQQQQVQKKKSAPTPIIDEADRLLFDNETEQQQQQQQKFQDLQSKPAQSVSQAQPPHIVHMEDVRDQFPRNVTAQWVHAFLLDRRRRTYPPMPTPAGAVPRPRYIHSPYATTAATAKLRCKPAAEWRPCMNTIQRYHEQYEREHNLPQILIYENGRLAAPLPTPTPSSSVLQQQQQQYNNNVVPPSQQQMMYHAPPPPVALQQQPEENWYNNVIDNNNDEVQHGSQELEDAMAHLSHNLDEEDEAQRQQQQQQYSTSTGVSPVDGNDDDDAAPTKMPAPRSYVYHQQQQQQHHHQQHYQQPQSLPVAYLPGALPQQYDYQHQQTDLVQEQQHFYDALGQYNNCAQSQPPQLQAYHEHQYQQTQQQQEYPQYYPQSQQQEFYVANEEQNEEEAESSVNNTTQTEQEENSVTTVVQEKTTPKKQQQQTNNNNKKNKQQVWGGEESSMSSDNSFFKQNYGQQRQLAPKTPSSKGCDTSSVVEDPTATASSAEASPSKTDDNNSSSNNDSSLGGVNPFETGQTHAALARLEQQLINNENNNSNNNTVLAPPPAMPASAPLGGGGTNNKMINNNISPSTQARFDDAFAKWQQQQRKMFPSLSSNNSSTVTTVNSSNNSTSNDYQHVGRRKIAPGPQNIPAAVQTANAVASELVYSNSNSNSTSQRNSPLQWPANQPPQMVVVADTTTPKSSAVPTRHATPARQRRENSPINSNKTPSTVAAPVVGENSNSPSLPQQQQNSHQHQHQKGHNNNNKQPWKPNPVLANVIPSHRGIRPNGFDVRGYEPETVEQQHSAALLGYSSPAHAVPRGEDGLPVRISNYAISDPEAVVHGQQQHSDHNINNSQWDGRTMSIVPHYTPSNPCPQHINKQNYTHVCYVRMRSHTDAYYFVNETNDPALKIEVGSWVLVDGDRGIDCGRVVRICEVPLKRGGSRELDPTTGFPWNEAKRRLLPFWEDQLEGEPSAPAGATNWNVIHKKMRDEAGQTDENFNNSFVPRPRRGQSVRRLANEEEIRWSQSICQQESDSVLAELRKLSDEVRMHKRDPLQQAYYLQHGDWNWSAMGGNHVHHRTELDRMQFQDIEFQMDMEKITVYFEVVAPLTTVAPSLEEVSSSSSEPNSYNNFFGNSRENNSNNNLFPNNNNRNKNEHVNKNKEHSSNDRVAFVYLAQWLHKLYKSRVWLHDLKRESPDSGIEERPERALCNKAHHQQFTQHHQRYNNPSHPQFGSHHHQQQQQSNHQQTAPQMMPPSPHSRRENNNNNNYRYNNNQQQQTYRRYNSKSYQQSRQ